MLMRSALAGCAMALAAHGAAAQATAGAPPPALLGEFRDDYGNSFRITDSAFVQLPRLRYHIVEWNIAERYLIARNDAANPSDQGLWTRIDWMPFTGMAPYEWGFCLTAYRAPSAAAARATAPPNRATPRTGCNGFPFSRMQRVASGRGLSPTERRIVAAVDSGVNAAAALLERTVNINSGTHNHAGVRAVADALAPEFQRLGFTTRWLDGAAWNRAGHLVAERRGSGRGPKLLLIGHLDTVFEPDSPFQRFERVGTDSARGPGIIDMKGGNVIILLAMQALQTAGVLDDVQVRVVFTGDEEDAGRPIALARAALIDAADWADIALGFENGPEAPDVAVIARRGSTGWQLRTAGTPAHSSQVFSAAVGSGAIYEMARILTQFHDSLANDPPLTFNPGMVVGGTALTVDAVQGRGTAFGKTNVVAESTYVAGDLRALTPEQHARAVATMERIVARHYPRTGATLAVDQSYPPFAPTDGNRRLLALLDQASRDAGLLQVGAVDPARAGAADIAFVAGRVDMALDGLGLKGRADHTVNETADLRQLGIQAKRAALVMARLARPQ